MKNLKKISVIVSLLIITTFCNVFAQQWSSEQKEVWAGVQKYWEVPSKGDADGFLSYFDESYKGWNNQSKVPQNKANTSKWIREDLKNNSTVLYTLTPLTIWVKGDFAFVHYYYGQLNKNIKTGKKTPSSGRWTDILMKKNGKWLLIGDHGGKTSNTTNAIME